MPFLTPESLVRELYLKAGDNVADIGCGTGAYTIPLAREVKEVGQVYALDINREMLITLSSTLEKNNILNVDTIWADVEKDTNIESYSLDAVVMSNILFQLENIDKAMENVTRILKPGGQLLVVDWSDSYGNIGPSEAHVVSESKAENLVKKFGFRVVKRLPAGKYHYAFIALCV